MYYKLTDRLNKNEIVKSEHGERYTYRFGVEEWVRSGIMVRYMYPDDILFGQYVEISDEEAEALLNEQRERYDELLQLAINLATEKHREQTDKGGNPYIHHLTAVANALDNTENKIVAYLHDICEDTDMTLDELRNMGFTERIVNSVDVITKRKGQSYDEYLKDVRKDSNAWHVKIADLKNNMDITRINDPEEEDFARIEKYKKALEFLTENL